VDQDQSDEHFMREAMALAAMAEARGEVPVGSVIVRDGKIIARGYNLRETAQDPTAHAELIAMRAAAARLGTFRLEDTTCYVTLEPCPMCAGALVLARLDRLVYGCEDPKTGACGSLYDIVRDERLNHRLQVTSGVLANDCAAVLQDFFRRRRPNAGKTS